MTQRRASSVVLAWMAAIASAGGMPALEAADAVDARTEATPLQTSKSVSFAQDRNLAWINPAVCDTDGNVYIVLVPKVDPRDLRRPPEKARDTKRPCDILRVSPDGKKTTLIQPDRIPAFSGANAVMTGGLAVDQSGLRAVVRVVRGEDAQQYIVSFDEKGQYKSRQEVDSDEIFVHQFEVLGSGEILVKGMKLGEGPRIAIMAANGESFRDLINPDETQDDVGAGVPGAGPAGPMSGHWARAGDGRIYFAASGKDAVNVIEPSGESRQAFRLPPMPRTTRLVDLKASGSHLLAVYYEERPEHRAAFWLAVYDATLGERQAVYGPADAVPVCYQHSDGQERFTLLNGATLITMSP